MKLLAARQNQSTKAIYAVIALVLFTNIILAAHKSLHATVLDDHCEIAQIAQNAVGTFADIPTLSLPEVFHVYEDTLLVGSIESTHFSHFQSRAPPVNFS